MLRSIKSECIQKLRLSASLAPASDGGTLARQVDRAGDADGFVLFRVRGVSWLIRRVCRSLARRPRRHPSAVSATRAAAQADRAEACWPLRRGGSSNILSTRTNRPRHRSYGRLLGLGLPKGSTAHRMKHARAWPLTSMLLTGAPSTAWNSTPPDGRTP